MYFSFTGIEALSRVQHVEAVRIFVPQRHGCLNSLRYTYVGFSTQSARPYSRTAGHGLRDKTRTKKGSKTLSKLYKDSVKPEDGIKTEDKTVVGIKGEDKIVVDEAKLSVVQRFKKAYKEHAKILVAVHLVTSSVWFGSFYYAAHT